MHRDDDHEGRPEGLAHDLRVMAAAMDRRRVLRLLAAASLVPLVRCGGDDDGAGDGTSGVDAGDGSCTAIPEETGGPYPGDGSNGANALALGGIVRSDIRSSIGDATGVAEGILLTVTLTVVDTSASCSPLSGYAVYIWHCDRGGNYSMYTGDAIDENYLRGVQETDSDGKVTFTTVFPACYSGRWPHIHFEVYPSVTSATSSSDKLHTSQLALPEAVCNEVYATTGYEQSVTNLGQISLASDNVFGDDGGVHQIAAVTGSAAAGYAATLTAAVAG